jgi:hypothetical protein
VDGRQEIEATEVTLHPLRAGRAPSGTEMPGGLPSASDREQTQRRVHDETHRGREMKAAIALVPEYDQQVLPGWCPTTETVRHCDAGDQPKSDTVAARPAAWLETRGSRVAAGQRTESRDDHPLDTHRNGCCDDGLAWVRRPSPATSLTSEERSITRTFARAVLSVSPPRDSTTRDAVRDQTPRLEARTCCVQLPLNDRRRCHASATDAADDVSARVPESTPDESRPTTTTALPRTER